MNWSHHPRPEHWKERKNMNRNDTFLWLFGMVFLLQASLPAAAENVARPRAEWSAHIHINGRSHQISFDKDGALVNVESLTSEFPNAFKLLSDGLEISIGDQKQSRRLVRGQTVEHTIRRIAYDEYITLTASNGEDTRGIRIRTLNSLLPSMQSAGTSPYPGHYYATLLNEKSLVKIDGKGEVVFYLRPDAPPAELVDLTVADPTVTAGLVGFWDFKKHVLPNPTASGSGAPVVRYSYHDHNPDYNRIIMGGLGGGERVVLDERYREIARYKMVADSSSSIDAAEGHDFILLADGHYIASSYEPVMVHNVPAVLNPNPQGSKVAAARLQEVKDGRVVFNWISTDHPELYGMSEAPFNDFASVREQFPDYIHFNSMEIDPADGNLICSFRNISAILKIDRKTGDILWVLSGAGDEFGLAEEQKTSNQHYARIAPDGCLTIFDNNVKNRKSRVLKLTLDETRKTVTDYRQYHSGDRFSVVCGSAVNLTGNVFVIGWGGSSDGKSALTEIDFDSGKKIV